MGITRYLHDFDSTLKNKFSKPNKSAIFLLGLNKSGTTVTLNLLSDLTGLSFTHDSIYMQEPLFHNIKNGNISLSKYVNKYSYPFSKDLIRYPISPDYTNFLNSYFKIDKYLVTIRNPFDNIRSILNRLKIPGNLDKLSLSGLNIHPN